MKGIELAELYYRECGKPMLDEMFPELTGLICAGLTGSGSECYGFDDEISRDHDFEPGFCIFIPDESLVDEKTEFRLEREYNRLPDEFHGFRRSHMAPVGGRRNGVHRISDYYMEKCGSPDGNLTIGQWLTIPDYAFAEAVNGCIFDDGYGLVTEIRNRLSSMPEDVRRKRIAGYLIMMAQSGQYNYGRCIVRGETAAAQLAVNEFVQNAMKTVFLLNRTYCPYYKWSFRALRLLPRLSLIAEILEYLLTSDNSESTAENKKQMIDNAALMIIDELNRQQLSLLNTTDLERQAYKVNDGIKDNDIRNANIMISVQ